MNGKTEKKMQLIIDGNIFGKATHSGIAKIFNNILPIICSYDQKLKVMIVFCEPPRIAFPKHPNISYFHLEFFSLLFRPRRFWRPFYTNIQWKFFSSKVKSNENTIWFSTYFTRPQSNWQGKEIVFVHDFIYELFPDLLPESTRIIKQKREAILHADLIFSNSFNTKQDLLKFYPMPENKIVIAPLSHDNLFGKRNLQEIKNIRTEKFLLFVGRRHYYKNFWVLLDAYANWEKAGKVKLFVVGPSWTHEEKSQIKGKGIEKNIFLFSNVDDDTLCDYYNQAEAFIFTSIYEGFGIPLLEAMACGCPVIASRIPTTEEIAGDIPFYFDYDDPNSLIDAFKYLENDKAVNEHTDRGLQLSLNFSWQKTAIIMYEALTTLLANPKKN